MQAVTGALEYSSIAVGIQALDSMVKAAPIQVVRADTICPGKYMILITGDVASGEASLPAGRESGPSGSAGGALIDELFIPNLHQQIIPAIKGWSSVGRDRASEMWDALGVLEAYSATAGIEAGDTAAKEADIWIPEIRLVEEMGGKSFVKMIGPIDAVQVAMEAGVKAVRSRGLLCRQVIIPQPHPEIRPFVL